MRKPVKIAAIAAGVVVLLLVTSPLWLGFAVKIAVNTVAPQISGTDVDLSGAYVNPFGLHVELVDLKAANPEGFKDPYAVTLGRLNVDVDATTVMSDVLVIEDVSVEDLLVALVKNDAGQSNVDIIGRNVNKALGGSDNAQKDASAPKPAEKPAAAQQPAKSRKLIINRLCLRNLKLKKGAVTIPCPSIELHDLGKDSGGYDLAQMRMAIIKEVWANIVASGADVMKLGLEGYDKSVEALKGAGNSLKEAGNALKGAGGNSVEALKDAGNRLKDAGNTLKGLFK